MRGDGGVATEMGEEGRTLRLLGEVGCLEWCGGGREWRWKCWHVCVAAETRDEGRTLRMTLRMRRGIGAGGAGVGGLGR